MQITPGFLARTALAATTCDGSQNFLGARWVVSTLDLAPKTWKRALALRYLALSPHYFGRTPANADLSTRDFLESELSRARYSRQLVIDGIVSPNMKPDSICLDYGCGPGFLAYAAAPRVARVIACDISRGVLACARVINALQNIEYRQVAANGTIPVPDGTADLVYSFAVIQHVSNDVAKGIISEMRRVLKPSGTAVCHVVIDAPPGAWRSEADWRADRSLRGRLRRKFALQCFSRTRENMAELLSAAGVRSSEIFPVAELGVNLSGDDIGDQHLCLFSK